LKEGQTPKQVTAKYLIAGVDPHKKGLYSGGRIRRNLQLMSRPLQSQFLAAFAGWREVLFFLLFLLPVLEHLTDLNLRLDISEIRDISH
jgi:hypothetical protein